jgi:hypothetical protein
VWAYKLGGSEASEGVATPRNEEVLNFFSHFLAPIL